MRLSVDNRTPQNAHIFTSRKIPDLLKKSPLSEPKNTLI
jgi:hypothetical protein